MEFDKYNVLVPINGAMPGELDLYMEAATKLDTTLAMESFIIDDTTLKEEYQNARKQHIPVQPEYLKFMTNLTYMYHELIPAHSKPLDTSQIVV